MKPKCWFLIRNTPTWSGWASHSPTTFPWHIYYSTRNFPNVSEFQTQLTVFKMYLNLSTELWSPRISRVMWHHFLKSECCHPDVLFLQQRQEAGGAWSSSSEVPPTNCRWEANVCGCGSWIFFTCTFPFWCSNSNCIYWNHKTLLVLWFSELIF